MPTISKQYGLRNCAWCNIEFEARRSNQIYCTSECCKKSTNQKVINRYHENKKRLEGAERLCEKCDSKLSRYNSNKLCYICQESEKDKRKVQTLIALGFFEYIEE